MEIRALLLTGTALLFPLFAQAQGGMIEGRILDLDGSPGSAIRVAAATMSGDGSALPEFDLIAITITNESGRYKLDGLAGGRYLILAGMIDSPTFYPGTTAVTKAIHVDLRAGAHVDDISFALASESLATLFGRIARFRTALSQLPITLDSNGHSSITTHAADDGSFEFLSLKSGMYMLRAPGLEPLAVEVGRGDVLVEMVPPAIGPGVSVRGTVMEQPRGRPPSTGRTVTLSKVSAGSSDGILGSSSLANLEAYVGRDGTFEFPQVPPGTYLLRTLPAVPGGSSRRLEVGDEEIEGIGITIPFSLEVTGRVEMTGGVDRFRPIFTATQGAFSASTSLRPDGTFTIRLYEGANRISLDRVPTSLVVRSIRYGSLDVTHAPLQIDAKTAPEEFVVTLEPEPGPVRDILSVDSGNRSTDIEILLENSRP